MTPDLSIVIVNHDTAEALRACLQSLARHGGSLNAETIVVDNASRDSSPAMVRQEFPAVRLLVNARNLGFAAACNIAIGASHGQYLLVLNPDTTVSDSTIETMAQLLEKNADAGAVGCQLRNPDGSIQPSAGNFPTLINLTLEKLPLLNRLPQAYWISRKTYYIKEQSPDWLAGACLMVRRQALEEAGLFDEAFFMYGEDVDLCYRLRQAGWRIVYTPSARVMHADEGKTAAKKLGKFINLRRGLLRFYRKHYPQPALMRLEAAMRTELLFKQLTSIQPANRQAYRQLIAELSSTS